MREMDLLSAVKIRAHISNWEAKYRGKQKRYPDGLGLYLQITGSGSKSWIFRYARDGRERYMGLGPCHTVTLADAREKARQARQKILDGKDPLAEKAAKKAEAALEAARAITFEAAAHAYFDQHEQRWANAKHRAQFLSTLREYAFPVIGRLAVADVETGHVLRILEPIWSKKTETASRVRGRIGRRKRHHGYAGG